LRPRPPDRNTNADHCRRRADIASQAEEVREQRRNGDRPTQVKTNTAGAKALTDDAATLEGYDKGVLTPVCF
jgi:hypothetical protein